MRKSGGRFGCQKYAMVSKRVSKIAPFSCRRNFESAMLTRKKPSLESNGSGPFGRKNLTRHGAPTQNRTRRPCHNNGIANINRMPA
jgi:hypothetical protein